MRDLTRRETYRRIWSRVKEVYDTGYVMSEAGLQTALHAELQKELKGVHVVVGPTWYDERDKPMWRPDLVIVDEKKITDIFELKFAPHHCPDRWEEDIPKLLGYVTNADRQKCPVSLDPVTGQLEKRWAEYSQERLQVPDDCRLHFVAVARQGCPAVSLPEVLKVPAFINCNRTLIHWFGCTGDNGGEWDIQCVTNASQNSSA